MNGLHFFFFFWSFKRNNFADISRAQSITFQYIIGIVLKWKSIIETWLYVSINV